MKINLKASTGNPWSPQSENHVLCLKPSRISTHLNVHYKLSKIPKFHFFVCFSLICRVRGSEAKNEIEANLFRLEVNKGIFLHVSHQSLSVCLSFHSVPKTLSQCVFPHSSHAWLSACLFILFLNQSVSLLFHPLPKPVCWFAFSFSSRAWLFPLVHKPVRQHAKMYSSIAFKQKPKNAKWN